MSEQSTCRSCGAPILWRLHARTGKRAPLDAAPSAQGNCRPLPDGTYEVVCRGEVGGPGLHCNHFQTCPDAATHRAPSARTKELFHERPA